MDLDGVRTFVVAAGSGQFQAAADELDLTQQGVSRRIAALEKDLGVRLFTRTARGVQLTADGQAFLPHARDLLRAEGRALAAVRAGQRPLRVDVVSRKVGSAALLREFHRAHQEIPVEVVTLFDASSAIEAVLSGGIDATFRCVPAPLRRLPEGIGAVRVLDEPHQLLTGPGHVLADAGSVTPAQLAGHKIWIPGIVAGTEWAAYYRELAREFGLTIEASGPNFGTESLLDAIATAPGLASLVGERTRLSWPAGYDLRRIAVRDPALAYPLWLIWGAGNPHRGLAALRKFCGAAWRQEAGTWVPEWARSEAPPLPAPELALRHPACGQAGHAGQGGGHRQRTAGGTAAGPAHAGGEELSEQLDPCWCHEEGHRMAMLLPSRTAKLNRPARWVLPPTWLKL
jgi:DNA-binding transcriptional LysR family regulator